MQRQLDAERKKQQSKKTEAGLNRVKTLLDKQTKLKEQVDGLEEVMKTLFTSVFVHRYRDKMPEIRAICIAELGEWLQNYRSGELNIYTCTCIYMVFIHVSLCVYTFIHVFMYIHVYKILQVIKNI